MSQNIEKKVRILSSVMGLLPIVNFKARREWFCTLLEKYINR
jgi:hypothetical protein